MGVYPYVRFEAHGAEGPDGKARQGKPEARVHVHENDIQRVKISLQCSSGLSRCLRVVKIQ
jgi:hypothetical protein